MALDHLRSYVRRFASSANAVLAVASGLPNVSIARTGYDNGRHRWTMNWMGPIPSSSCTCNSQFGRLCLHGFATAARQAAGMREIEKELHDALSATWSEQPSRAQRADPDPTPANDAGWDWILSEPRSAERERSSRKVSFRIVAAADATLRLDVSYANGTPVRGMPRDPSPDERRAIGLAFALPRGVDDLFVLQGADARPLLDLLLTRLEVVDQDGFPMQKGEPVDAADRWETDDRGNQSFRLHDGPGAVVDVEGPFVVIGTTIRELRTAAPRNIAVRMARSGAITPEESAKMAAKIASVSPGTAPREVRLRRITASPVPNLVIDKVDGQAVARVNASYDGIDIPIGSVKGRTYDPEANELSIVVRDLDAEEAIATAAAGRGLVRTEDPTLWSIPGDGSDEDAAAFEFENAEQMRGEGWTVTPGGGWSIFGRRIDRLELCVQDEGLFGSFILDVAGDGLVEHIYDGVGAIAAALPPEATEQDVRDTLSGRVRSGHIACRSDEGHMLMIEAEQLISLVFTLRHIILNARAPGEPLRANVIELADLHSLSEDVGLSAPDSLSRMLALLDNGQPPLLAWPAAFIGERDERQLFAASWLRMLGDAGYAGILADDVGFGKTVEVLLHLASLKEDGLLPDGAIVAVPTNAVEKWEDDFRRLFPSLGFATKQRVSTKLPDDADAIVLVSHGVAEKSGDLLERNWTVVALDEAQSARNPVTNLAAFMKAVPAVQKIPVTATPIENSLDDLWTLMSFANPGLLGTNQVFRRSISNPILDADATAATRLNSMTAPFILMREDEHRAKPVFENVIVGLHPEMRDTYDSFITSARKGLERRIDRAEKTGRGLSSLYMTTMTSLMRVRQLCCTPLICDQARNPSPFAYQASPKTAAIVDKAADIVQDGGRILLFSEFVEHLRVLEAALAAEGVRVAHYHGQISKKERASNARLFKAGEVDVLLMTTKSGGRALDFNEADAVFVADHWWNPKVERQAVGRATRRGQTKTIKVYRFVTDSPVEHGILEMQARKNVLSNVITPGRIVEVVEGMTMDDYRRFLKTFKENDQAMRMAA